MKKNIDEQCIKVCNNKIISLGEKGCTIRLNNKNQKEVVLIQIDGCAIKEGIKCDQAYCYDGEDHFIEYKGNQISHAINQLERSIQLLGEPKKVTTYGEIVYGSCNIPNNDFTKKVKLFSKKGVILKKHKSGSNINI